MKKQIIRTIIFIVIVSVTLYCFAKEISQFYALSDQNERVILEAKKLEKANQQLKKKIELMNKDSEYVERVVRKELGMIKKGEKVYRFRE